MVIPSSKWNWLPIDSRPLSTGYYLVGHRGHQEKLLFRGPEREWKLPIKLGWFRETARGWQRDDPAERFNATHCVPIELPPTEGGK